MFNRKNKKDRKTELNPINFIIATPIICIFFTFFTITTSYYSYRDCSMLPAERQCSCYYMFSLRSLEKDKKTLDSNGVYNKGLFDKKCNKK